MHIPTCVMFLSFLSGYNPVFRLCLKCITPLLCLGVLIYKGYVEDLLWFMLIVYKKKILAYIITPWKAGCYIEGGELVENSGSNHKMFLLAICDFVIKFDYNIYLYNSGC